MIGTKDKRERCKKFNNIKCVIKTKSQMNVAENIYERNIERSRKAKCGLGSLGNGLLPLTPDALNRKCKKKKKQIQKAKFNNKTSKNIFCIS